MREFARRLLLAETLTAAGGGVGGLLLSLGALFVCDRWDDTPPELRAALAAAGAAAAAWAAAAWLRRRTWRRRGMRALARMVQRRHPRLGDSLLGAVELSEMPAPGAGVSPALCQAALRQVAESAARFNFRRAVSTRLPRLCLWSALSLAVLVILLPASLCPEALWNTLERWRRPLTDVPRYTFAALEELPAHKVVAHGEGFQLVCALAPGGRWQPRVARLRLDRQPARSAQFRDGRAAFDLPGQTRSARIFIRAGDATSRLLVRPVFRPELIALEAEITLPDYLGLPPRTAPVEHGFARWPAGSGIRLIGTADRCLAGALLASRPDIHLAAQSNRFTSATWPAESLTGELACAWTDNFGLEGAAPRTFVASVVPDEPPAVGCSGAGRTVAILSHETLALRFQAADDHGLRELWVEWTQASPDAAAEIRARGRRTLRTGGHDRRTLEGEFLFAPELMDIPEESLVTLRAGAADYFPGRAPSFSDEYRVYVLGEAGHARLVQEQAGALYARLEDVAREEERLLEANRGLAESAPLDAAGRQAALEAGADGEAANARTLAQLAAETRGLLQEALRNPAVGESTLGRMLELARGMNRAGAQMEQAAAALGEAAAPPGSEQLAAAIGLEEQVLAELGALRQDLAGALDNAAIRNFVNRLRAAAARQAGLAGALQQMSSSALGVRLQDLAPATLDRLALLAAGQDRDREEARQIQDDLGGFYSRTSLDPHGEVWRAMQASEMGARLESLSGMVRHNLVGRAGAEAGRWERQFKAWADRLTPAPAAAAAESGEAGGAEEGEPEESVRELALALLRALQQESGLREQTRRLDGNRVAEPDYPAAARQLAQRQNAIAEELQAASGRDGDPRLGGLATESESLMSEAADLLRRPQTGAETIAVQTEIIELIAAGLLAPPEEENAENGGAASARLRDLLQIAMEEGGQSGGGGSLAGGPAAGRPAPARKAGGGRPEARSGSGLGGPAGRDWPEEFRDVLEAYFAVLEKTR